MSLIASLPMYDWPECRAETDAQWANLKSALRAEGVEAPDRLTRDAELQSLWRAPNLVLAQTCWGPMEQGLAAHVHVLGQPDYSDFEGGDGALYSSAILMRKGDDAAVAAPDGADAIIPIKRLQTMRFVCNSSDSMSGFLGLHRDLNSLGATVDIFSERSVSGSHRMSAQAVADGLADVCACDCRSWALLQQHEPGTAARLQVVGWTSKRLGLPFIMACQLREHAPAVRRALHAVGMLAGEPDRK